jgi:hypothetical protein
VSLIIVAQAGALAGVRLGTGAIYLISVVPLVIAALIASVIWRSAKRERVSRGLRSRLESPNPQTRRDALDKVTDEVLSEHSVMLCELLARESDPDVLDALAAAIARSKWELTEDAALMQLRRWVAGGQVLATSSSTSVSAPVPATTTPTVERVETQPSAPPEVVPTLAPAAAAPDAEPIAAPLAAPLVVGAAPWPSTSANGREQQAGDVAAGVPEPGADLYDLVHKVREVLGEGVERVELVSIEGELLTSWSSGQRTAGDAAPPSDDA